VLILRQAQAIGFQLPQVDRRLIVSVRTRPFEDGKNHVAAAHVSSRIGN